MNCLLLQLCHVFVKTELQIRNKEFICACPFSIHFSTLADSLTTQTHTYAAAVHFSYRNVFLYVYHWVGRIFCSAVIFETLLCCWTCENRFCSKFFRYLQWNDNKKQMAKSKEQSPKTHVPILHRPLSNVCLFYYSARRLISVSELGSWSKGRKYRSVRFFFFKFFSPAGMILHASAAISFHLLSIFTAAGDHTDAQQNGPAWEKAKPSPKPWTEQHTELGKNYVVRTSVAKCIFKF